MPPTPYYGTNLALYKLRSMLRIPQSGRARVRYPPVRVNIVPAELNALSSPVGTVCAYVTLFYAPTADGVDRLIDGFACRVQCSDDV